MLDEEKKLSVPLPPAPPAPGTTARAYEEAVKLARKGEPGSVIDTAYSFLVMLTRSKSYATVDAYRAPLNHFLNYLAAGGRDPLSTPMAEITSEDLIGCLEQFVANGGNWPGATGNIPATATRKIVATTFNRFARYLKKQEKGGVWPTLDITDFADDLGELRQGPKARPKRTPKDDAVSRLITGARNARGGEVTEDQERAKRLELIKLRDIAILEMLRSSGVRVSELCNLKRGDLEREEHAAHVFGKGSKERKVYFDETAWRALSLYLEARADGAAKRGLNDYPLLASHSIRGSKTEKRGLTPKSIREVLRKYRDTLDADIPLTPHSLRHYFGTKVLRETHDLAVVQDLLGHASPNTTRIYAEIDDEQKRAAHKKTFGKKKESF